MTYSIEDHTETRMSAYFALRKHIDKYRLPFIFDKAIYKHDGHPMMVKCMFGHDLLVKPVELKTPYRNQKRKDQPQCWLCNVAKIGQIELKHRVDIYYDSGKRAQVLSPYMGPSMPMKYSIDGRVVMSSPKKMRHHLRANPQTYRA